MMHTIRLTYTPPGRPYKWEKQLSTYLYEIQYDRLDYTFALSYFKDQADDSVFDGGCSSVRKGNLYGRNLDWTYSSQLEYVVHTAERPGHFASIGVAGGCASLTSTSTYQSRSIQDYKLLPFKMYDGVNRHGVFANLNVVPTDYGTNVSEPAVLCKAEICGQMLVRYILDKFESAQQAVEHIRDYVRVYFPKSIHTMNYELHYMVGDLVSTYILEFKNNRAVVTDVSDNAVMTNFYIDGVRWNDDGSVYTPETQTDHESAHSANLISDRGSGLERYNLIKSRMNELETISDMQKLLIDLHYTRSYLSCPKVSDPYWYTEFVGEAGLTVSSKPSDFSRVIAIADTYYLHRKRDDGLTWHTTHSSAYDIHLRQLNIAVQEGSKWYTISL